jgi:hypothetical protein
MRGDWGAITSRIPGAAVAGAARALLSNKINPGFAGLPVDKSAFIFDGAAILLGAFGGQFLPAGISDEILSAGLIYGAEDVTHEAWRRFGKNFAAPAAPATVARAAGGRASVPAQAPVRRASGGSRVFGGL